jgi:hypothetical protein
MMKIIDVILLIIGACIGFLWTKALISPYDDNYGFYFNCILISLISSVSLYLLREKPIIKGYKQKVILFIIIFNPLTVLILTWMYSLIFGRFFNL